MTLKEKILSDLKESMKNRDSLKLSVLRMLSSVIQNREIEKKEFLTEEEILSVFLSEVKKRKEAIEGFNKGGRIDQAEQENLELAILQSYLPEQMSEEEIRKVINEAISSVRAEGMKDIGLVMKEIMPKVKGKADGNLINSIVRELLN